MDVAVTLAVAGVFHERGDGVPQVERHGFARRRGGIRGGCRVGPGDQVRLRAGQVDGCLGQGKQRFGKTDQVRDLRGGRGLDDRLRVSEADVFGSEDAQSSAMKTGSAPPSIIRASQYNAALASEFRTDLMRAEIKL